MLPKVLKSLVKLSIFPLSGLGFGFLYLPATVCVATYFEKKRAFASGIATCGGGFGTFIFALIIKSLDDKIGWSWTLMIIGGFVIVCIPLGLLFKPTKDNTSSRSTKLYERTVKKADIDCFSSISVYFTKMGESYIDLVYDMNFIIYMLSNLLANIGFAIPYAYTMASLKINQY